MIGTLGMARMHYCEKWENHSGAQSRTINHWQENVPGRRYSDRSRFPLFLQTPFADVSSGIGSKWALHI
jgi:hypothetical protein